MHNKTNLFLILCLFIMLTLTACNHGTSPTVITGFYFDTVINITIYDPCEESVTEHILSLCETYDTMFSPTNPESDIYKINLHAGTYVTVSDETASLLSQALAFSKATDGIIDPSIHTVFSLWNFDGKTNSVPSAESIRQSLPLVDYREIIIEENRVYIPQSASISLGFLAKGYICDQIRDYLLSTGIENALINLGGNITVMGHKPSQIPFCIGIEKPFYPSEAILSLTTTDCSIVTSGVSQRYFYGSDENTEGNTTLYHHILNPDTGYPIHNGLYSVTIIGPESVICDGLSTTCFSLGLDKGMEFLSSYEDYHAVFITEDYQIIYSPDFPLEILP